MCGGAGGWEIEAASLPLSVLRKRQSSARPQGKRLLRSRIPGTPSAPPLTREAGLAHSPCRICAAQARIRRTAATAKTPGAIRERQAVRLETLRTDLQQPRTSRREMLAVG